MNRALILSFCLLAGIAAEAQVHLDRPLVMTAPTDSLRQITGLGPATEESSLMTLGGAFQGTVMWATASGLSWEIILTTTPGMQAYRNGTVIRWTPHTTSIGFVKVNVDGLGLRPVYRTDGLPVAQGQMRQGKIVEMAYLDTAFFITTRGAEGCPNGFVGITEGFCIQLNEGPSTDIFSASINCRNRGARLCNWSEYMIACSTHAGQLNGMFDDWEWIDDTSNHSHTADQAGRYTCQSLQNVAALPHPNTWATVRCCYTKP